MQQSTTSIPQVCSMMVQRGHVWNKNHTCDIFWCNPPPPPPSNPPLFPPRSKDALVHGFAPSVWLMTVLTEGHVARMMSKFFPLHGLLA